MQRNVDLHPSFLHEQQGLYYEAVVKKNFLTTFPVSNVYS